MEVEPRALRFAGFEFDLLRAELKGADGEAIALRPKAELLLRRFLAEPGRLFGREELMDALWPAAVVTDDSLVQCVGELRAALDDRAQALIRTVPRRGYRFEAAVAEVMSQSRPMPLADVPAPVPQAAAAPAQAMPASAPTPAPDPVDRVPSRSRTRAVGVMVAAALLALAAIAAWRWLAPPPVRVDEEIASRHVIALMPLRADDGSRALADRLGDQIATQMSNWPATRLIGRARTAALDGAPLARIAETLHATYVVSGHLATAPGGATSVEVQIVATQDGALLGAEHFTLPAAPSTDALSGLGQEVMSFTRGRIGIIDEANATRPGHVPDAAELTMLGWAEVYRRRDAALTLVAIGRFAEALRQDPDSLIALNGMGAAYLQMRSGGGGGGGRLSAAQSADGERAIERALRVAPDDATASLNWGNLQTLRGRPDLAIPAIEKSNRTVPGFTNGHLMLARALLSVGRTFEVQAEADRAARLAALMHDSTRAAAAWTLAAEAALMQGDDAHALELARRAVAEYPATRQGHAVLAAAESLSGLAQEAATEMATFRRSAPTATIANFDDARPSTNPTYLAERARLYEGLRRAGLPER